MQLAADAAERAWAMCLGEGDGDLGLEPRLDLARRLAASLGTNGAWWPAERTRFDAVAQRTGMRPRELARLASAWRHGGADAVGVLDEVWTPDDDGLDEGRAVCPPGSRVRDNRVTLPGSDVQLRLSRGGSWYRFERVGRAWELTGGPAADPAELVTVAAAPSR
jgi:hypothetical protein